MIRIITETFLDMLVVTLGFCGEIVKEAGVFLLDFNDSGFFSGIHAGRF